MEIYQREAKAWMRENGIDPDDLDAVRKFVDQFRRPAEVDMAEDRKFSPPYVFGKEFLDLSFPDQDIYEREAKEWLQENGIDLNDLDAVREFVDQFRQPAKDTREELPSSDSPKTWTFKRPLVLDADFYDLPMDGRTAFLNELTKQQEEMAKIYAFKPLKKFDVCTPETMSDFIDDDRDEITPEMRESLKQDVLSGRIAGYVDEDGCIHMGG